MARLVQLETGQRILQNDVDSSEVQQINRILTELGPGGLAGAWNIYAELCSRKAKEQGAEQAIANRNTEVKIDGEQEEPLFLEKLKALLLEARKKRQALRDHYDEERREGRIGPEGYSNPNLVPVGQVRPPAAADENASGDDKNKLVFPSAKELVAGLSDEEKLRLMHSEKCPWDKIAITPTEYFKTPYLTDYLFEIGFLS